MNSQQSPSLPWYRWLNSSGVIRLLETVQDLIVICLCVGLFSVMVLQLREMVLSLLPPIDFQPVTSDILFLLILVELFRLLIIYLQEHRVSIGVAVEVSIVSVLREMILRGVLETPWVQVLAACVFLLVLGGLLVIRVWIPPTFEGIDPEQVVSERHRSRLGSQTTNQRSTQNSSRNHRDMSEMNTSSADSDRSPLPVSSKA
ncbi:phosphate-starvation-inducible PsiE family protein [Romeria aff. gracilis LEGE 07310]|uniref:Phosphate-starvation-inducible PsiE family protein n=1 Tax=Vasconcelosia minhoensis LEGE 07310 TaxID=915328 RepID=A0A8J7AMH6_9CYAN|nr:phosphate-starvation-inducible PsiE family protein [Romeria gracilis]MBE9077011.1 phosphate-starvation-inducible PsiE family protein [Romeria aff. gracilis LEGE 07310]